MLIRIHKPRKAGRAAVMTCIRADGSQTVAPITVGVEHDLVHFAVETTLKLTDSFYSLLARGWQIQDFNVPGATKHLDLPVEAGRTEFIVGLLQIERRNGQPYDDFNAQLAQISAQRSIRPPIQIDEAALSRVRAKIDEMCAAWTAVSPGASMELEFPDVGAE